MLRGVQTVEVTPLPELELAAIIARSGLPQGVFNLVCGTGLAVGAPLSADPRIAKISFTGSNAVGVQVMQRAAETVKGVSLELGVNPRCWCWLMPTLNWRWKWPVAADF